MRARQSVLCAVLMLLVVSACIHFGPGKVADQIARSGGPGPWTKNGRAVAWEVSMYYGSPTCGYPGVVFVNMGWPLGTRLRGPDDRQYARDPSGQIRPGLRIGVKLPVGARDSGYRAGALELWLSDSEPDAVYLRVGSDVERWPRSAPILYCE